jgi:hypothetical protein
MARLRHRQGARAGVTSVYMRSSGAGWQEHGLLDKVLERFTVPVTVFQLHSE